MDLHRLFFAFENSNQWESHIRSRRVMALDSTVNSHPIVQEVVPCAFYIFCLWLEL